jgi:MFS family permease
VRRLAYLTSAIVFVDTLFFAVLTPLLPHLAHTLGLSKTGAGVLAAAYPAGALVGAIPSGVVAARFGVKRTVLVGLTLVAACTIVFGVARQPWQLDAARFMQGLASSFSWTGALAWLVAGTPAERRGAVIGTAFASAVGGALFGPVLGGVAAVAGVGWTFGAVGVASLGLVAWAGMMAAERPERPQPLGVFVRAVGNATMVAAIWLVVLPSLLFGALGVLAPLRLSVLGFGSIAIGATYLSGAAGEAANNLVVGRLSDRRGPLYLIRAGLLGSVVVAALLPWPGNRFLLGAVVICAATAFGTLFTPAMTYLAQHAEERGLDYGYAFALVTLAWAPGQTTGAAGGAALAHATSDAVPYLVLSVLCALTLAGAWWFRTSTGSTMPSAPGSSASSWHTTAAD